MYTFLTLAEVAQFQITDFSWFGSVQYGHGSINCLASESFVVPLKKKKKKKKKKPDNWWEEVLWLLSKMIIRNLVLSCTVIHMDNLSKFVSMVSKLNSVSYVSQQRVSPW